MTQQKPLIETAHVSFTGMSRELFEKVVNGTELIFTVRGICKKTEEELMKTTHEDRRKMIVEVVRIVEGISEEVKIDVDDEGNPKKPEAKQPSLYDPPADDEKSADDKAEAPSNVSTGKFGGGPSFSSGDDA